MNAGSSIKSGFNQADLVRLTVIAAVFRLIDQLQAKGCGRIFYDPRQVSIAADDLIISKCDIEFSLFGSIRHARRRKNITESVISCDGGPVVPFIHHQHGIHIPFLIGEIRFYFDIIPVVDRGRRNGFDRDLGFGSEFILGTADRKKQATNKKEK